VPPKLPDLPPLPTQDIDEVDRALSVLGGRHPEHEKSRRKMAEAAKERSVQLEAELAASARRRRRRILVIGANSIAVAAVAFVGWRLSERTQGIRAGVARAEASWTARGFTEMASNALTAGRTLESDLPDGSCFAAVTAAAGPLKVNLGTSTTEGAGSVAWCACAPGHVVIEAPPAAATVGFALLRVDSKALGGPLARGWLDFSPGAWAPGGEDCGEATLDGWIGDHHAPAATPDADWLTAVPARAPLVKNGFRVVSGVAAGRPFGLLEAPAASCLLALGAPGDALSLRATGGVRLVKGSGVIGWCASAAATTTLWRDGHSAVTVIASPADRLGGLLGLRDAAEEAKLGLAQDAAWVDDGDLAWNAGAVLRSSGITTPTTKSLPDIAGEPDTRLVALTFGPSAVVVPAPASVVVACEPPLAAAAVAGVHSSVCATSAKTAWWRKTAAPAAEASADLPVWLAPLEPHHEPDAVARIPELLGLARRLARAGFSPTVLEGVTEQPDGVKVIGRAGEDSIVAVGLGPRAPWTFPYTDKVPWDVGDEPAMVPIKPGQTVKLTASPLPNSPPEQRRTIVFRHAIQP
jgi:hypothetical protein